MKSEITTIIKDYKFQTVIGMFDFERVAKQEVKVSLEFRSTSLIDYVLVEDFIKEFNAKKVPEGFSYNSGKNTEWETVESLRQLIQEHVDTTFKV